MGKLASHAARRIAETSLLTVLALVGSALGQNYDCQSNSVLYVGGPVACWAGSDIGAQINSAYAALPSEGSTIYILPQTGGGLSKTAPVFTFGGTPGSGSTYVVAVRCGV